MSSINLDDIAGNEYAIAYNWRLAISGLPSPVKTLASEAGLTFEGQSGVLNMNCSTIGIPSATATVAEVNIRGHQNKQWTNQIVAGELTHTFYERKDWKLSKFFEDWKDLAWDKVSGEGKPKADYLGRQGWKISPEDTNKAIQANYELYWFAPSEVTVPDLVGDGGEVVQFDVVMNYISYKRT